VRAIKIPPFAVGGRTMAKQPAAKPIPPAGVLLF
jgi:hypothetical protein